MLAEEQGTAFWEVSNDLIFFLKSWVIGGGRKRKKDSLMVIIVDWNKIHLPLGTVVEQAVAISWTRDLSTCG